MKKYLIIALIASFVGNLIMAYACKARIDHYRIDGIPYQMKMELFGMDCDSHVVEGTDTANKQIGIFYIHPKDSSDANSLARIYTMDDKRGYKPAFAMYVDSSSRFFKDLTNGVGWPCPTFLGSVQNQNKNQSTN